MAELGPGLPHGTSPWAEGPREDKEERIALNHPNASKHKRHSSAMRWASLPWSRSTTSGRARHLPLLGPYAVSKASFDTLVKIYAGEIS